MRPLGRHTGGCGPVGLTCCHGGLVTEEPGLAAWDDLEVCVLRGLWQVLGPSSQECIEVLQPRDLQDRKHSQARATVKLDGESEVQAAHTSPFCPQVPEPGGSVTLSRTKKNEEL